MSNSENKMFQSKFLLNRQKIFNPLEIHTAIASYFSHLPDPQSVKFFYRLEWYKIGIVVPLLVYSTEKPLMKLMPECQLLETATLDALPADAETLDFAIFAVPAPGKASEADFDETIAEKWLQKQLKGAATLTETGFGPNNCLYYEKGGVDHRQQTVTIKGSMKVKDLNQLEEIRRQPLGKCSELGCGLLYLTR